MIDCDDEDCRWNGACMENICDDGIDNDGDGDIEIVVALMKSTSNKIYVWNSDGSLFPGWPKVLEKEYWSPFRSP